MSEHYTLTEAREVIDTHDMDPHHRELLQWLADTATEAGETLDAAMGIVNSGDVRHLMGEQGETAHCHSVINRANAVRLMLNR